MRFLRTASTSRLLAAIGGVVAAAAAAAAIAVAATGSGPVPKAQPLANSLQQALTARPVSGFSADINFTNNLISASNFTGGPRDPLLQGASGRIWISDDGRLRVELQGGSGDSQVVLNKGSFWISDPASQTVYEGNVPGGGHAQAGHAQAGHGTSSAADAVPTVAHIQTELNRLMGHLRLGGDRTSNPTDIGGRPAYSVRISPRHAGGLVGAAQIAWDAVTGTPLQIAVYARGSNTPVLALQASNISYGKLAATDFAVSPPRGYKVVRVATPGAQNPTGPMARTHKPTTGLRKVQSHLAFTLAAPKTLGGRSRHHVRLLDWAGVPAALVTYGQGLGTVAVLEQRHAGQTAQRSQIGGLSLPTIKIHGATGTELATALGTVLRYAHDGVSYTILGSVRPAAAEQMARALSP